MTSLPSIAELAPIAQKAACVRVMLIDHHALVRSGFRRILEAERDFDVVAEAADVLEASQLVQGIGIDVVLIGMTMQRMGEIGALRRLVDVRPDARVLFLSQSPDLHSVKLAFGAGARGFMVMKDAIDADLVRAVRTVAAGGWYISPELSATLIRSVRTSGAEPADPVDRLTRRERQVLQLIAQGKSGREIAGLLGVSHNTVAVHRSKAMNRLGIHKTAELVVFAVERGLVARD